MCGDLVFWRLNSGVSLAIAWAGALLQMLAGLSPDPANLAILVVLYSTARNGGPAMKWIGHGSAGLGAIVASAYLTFRNPPYSSNTPLGLPFTLGDLPLLASNLVLLVLAAFAMLGLRRLAQLAHRKPQKTITHRLRPLGLT